MMDNLIGAALFVSSYSLAGFVLYFIALKYSLMDIDDIKTISGFIVVCWPVVIVIGVFQILCSLVEKMAGK